MGFLLVSPATCWRSEFRRARWAMLFALSAIGIYLAAVVDLYIRLPVYRACKATYLLGLLPCIAVLAAAGLLRCCTTDFYVLWFSRPSPAGALRRTSPISTPQRSAGSWGAGRDAFANRLFPLNFVMILRGSSPDSGQDFLLTEPGDLTIIRLSFADHSSAGFTLS